MEYREKIRWLVLVALAGIVFAIVLHYFELSRVADSIAQVLLVYSVVHLLIFLVLRIVVSSIFDSWKILAFIYLPLALMLIIITPETGGFMQPDREIMTWWTAGGFVVISLVLIVYKQIRLKRG